MYFVDERTGTVSRLEQIEEVFEETVNEQAEIQPFDVDGCIDE